MPPTPPLQKPRPPFLKQKSNSKVLQSALRTSCHEHRLLYIIKYLSKSESESESDRSAGEIDEGQEGDTSSSSTGSGADSSTSAGSDNINEPDTLSGRTPLILVLHGVLSLGLTSTQRNINLSSSELNTQITKLTKQQELDTIDILDLLLSYNANPSIRCVNKQNILHYVVYTTSLPLLHWYLTLPIEIQETQVKEKDMNNLTPLEVAINNEYMEMAEELVGVVRGGRESDLFDGCRRDTWGSEGEGGEGNGGDDDDDDGRR